MTTEPIARLFDRECCARVERGPAAVDELDAVGTMLLDCLAEAGFSGGTVLELGAGDGSLSRELLRRGATAVTGLDLSPRSVAYATERAAAMGAGERLSYRIVDGAVEPLEPHDAVVSEKVFCCYPNAAALLTNSLGAARSHYALVLPESRGPAGLVARLEIGAENTWNWLTGDAFRAYVHDVNWLQRTVVSAGFRPRAARRHARWLALSFSRD